MCKADNGITHEVVNKHRLPGVVKPIHSAITLRPDLTNFTFAGAQVTDIRVKKPVKEIRVNAVDLDINHACVVNDKGCMLEAKVSYDTEHEQAVFTFNGVVGKGVWQLHNSFTGQINNKLHGFYRSFYKDAEGKEHVIVSTQFEPGDARRAYPCFDEPSMKGQYTMRFVTDPHLDVYANGAELKSELVEETKAVTVDYGNGLQFTTPAVVKRVTDFKTTMKMSTYLTAWVIGEFEATETIKVNRTPLRVLTPRGQKHLGNFALKAGQFALTWFENYFGIRYPGGKLDMIAIPNFAFGAMENTGLITYRGTALLVNEATATINELLRVAEVVAHEIAHQWFGNLVTMKWWNGLWLNEAFATFMAAKVMESFRKEWDRWTSFGMERGAAMRVDGLVSSRAVEAPVLSSTQAQGAFDAITYRKGASILRMLEQFIGEEQFRKGVANYLKKHSYGNTEGSDLWDALSASSGKPVAKIMDSWVYQAGHPVVTVSESEVSGSVTLSQKVFKYLADQADPNQSWMVPVCLRYKTAEGEQTRWELLTDREQTIYLGENLEWLVANAGGHGFYRTLYSPALAAKVTANVQTTLSAIERFNTVNDAWACAQAGLSTASDYLNIIKLFSAETDPNVWSIISGSLSRLKDLLPASNHAAFEQTVCDLARPSLERLGYAARTTDTVQDRQLRGTIISLLGTTGGDKAVQAKADELFSAYKAHKDLVPADVVPAVVRLVAHTGDHADYQDFLSLHAGTNVPQEAVRYLGALAAFQDRDLLTKSLSALVDGTAKTQDAPSLAMQLLGNPAIAAEAWSFIKSNWARIVATYPENGLITMVSGVVALDTPELEEDVTRFFSEHKVKGGDKAVAQSLEMLRVSVAFRQRECQSLCARFA